MWIPFFQEYITGTTDVVKITNTIPPNDIIAMDTMTGRIRHSPAKTTASQISLYVS